MSEQPQATSPDVPQEKIPKLLIVYHTQTGNTEQLAKAAYEAALEIEAVETTLQRAFDTSIDDLKNCDGLLLGTPENFGTMSGAVKDFFDRTYYPLENHFTGLPYGIFVSAGNDGTGAVREIERIAKGYPFELVAEPIIGRGEVTKEYLQRCRELGQTLAAGLELGIF